MQSNEAIDVTKSNSNTHIYSRHTTTYHKGETPVEIYGSCGVHDCSRKGDRSHISTVWGQRARRDQPDILMFKFSQGSRQLEAGQMKIVASPRKETQTQYVILLQIFQVCGVWNFVLLFWPELPLFPVTFLPTPEQMCTNSSKASQLSRNATRKVCPQKSPMFETRIQ